jgi:hypothetical protein
MRLSGITFMNVSTHGCVTGSDFMSAERRQSKENRLTTITAPLINLPHRCFAVDVIDTRLSRFVLLVSTEAVKFMLSANVYSCPKVHEVVDVVAVIGERPKFLNQLRFEEWFDVVIRPRETPEGDVILCDQSRLVVKQEPHCSLEVRKKIRSLRLRRTVDLDGDRNRAPIKVAKAAERDDGRVIANSL